MRRITFILLLSILLVGCGKKDKVSVTEDYEKTRAESIKAEDELNYSKISMEVYNKAPVTAKIATWLNNPFTSKDELAESYCSDNKKASEEVNKKAYMRLDEEKQAAVDKKVINYSLVKYAAVFVILLVIILLIIFFAIVSKNQSAKVVVVPERESANYRDAKVNYPRLLRDICNSKNLNYDEQLSESNGNARAAVERLS